MAEAVKELSVGLTWTGHPFIDAGVAGLTVFANKRDPTEVTAADLERFAEWASNYYFTKELGAWATVSFNAMATDYLNPSFSAEKKREELGKVLRSFAIDKPLGDLCCTFFDIPAHRIVARDFVPMLTGRGLANFFADGQAGLPVSGLAITALQGLSLAAPLVSGRLLVVAADDPRLTLQIVNFWQEQILKRAQLSATTGEKCAMWAGPRTRLVETLTALLRRGNVRQAQGSVTIYHATNSGQGPDIAIHTLDAPALRFLQTAQTVKHRDAWEHVTREAWRSAQRKDQDPQYATRNDVFEMLFELPLEAPQFIRRFFRKPVFNRLRPTQPVTKAKSRKQKASIQASLLPMSAQPFTPLWSLIEAFLEVIVAMEKQRIEAIRTLGDRLAEAVQVENDRPLFRRIYETRRPFEVRSLLISLGRKRLIQGNAPMIRFEEYLTIFEEGDELARADFGLAWDLTKIRTIEALYERRWFDGNQEVLVEVNDPDQEGEL